MKASIANLCSLVQNVWTVCLEILGLLLASLSELFRIKRLCEGDGKETRGNYYCLNLVDALSPTWLPLLPPEKCAEGTRIVLCRVTQEKRCALCYCLGPVVKRFEKALSLNSKKNCTTTFSLSRVKLKRRVSTSAAEQQPTKTTLDSKTDCYAGRYLLHPVAPRWCASMAATPSPPQKHNQFPPSVHFVTRNQIDATGSWSNVSK